MYPLVRCAGTVLVRCCYQECSD